MIGEGVGGHRDEGHRPAGRARLRQGHPGAGPGASTSGCRTSRPATCSGPPSATDRRSGSRRAATWTAASSCPTTSPSGCCSTGSPSAMRRRASILDGFPRNRAQAETLDQALREQGGQVELAVEIDVPAEELVHRLSGRWVCRDTGHVYNEASNPPRSAGKCDLDGSPLIQREDDKAETIRNRHGPDPDQPARRRRPLPGDRRAAPDRRRPADRPGHRRPAGVPADGVASRIRTRRRRGRPADMVTRKSAPRSPGCARPAASWPRSWRSSRSSSSPASSTGHLDRLAEAHIRKAGADAVVQGLSRDQPAPAIPGQPVHLHRRRDRPRHPGRADHPRRPDRVDRRRGHRRRLARRRRPDLLSSATPPPDVARAHRHDPRGDGGRHRRRRPGRPHRGHLGRGRGRRPSRRATASSASSSATASAPRCTRSRRSPTTAPAARAASWSRACAWPSSRC